MFLQILKPISHMYLHFTVSFCGALLILSLILNFIANNSEYYYSLIEISNELIIAARSSFAILTCGIITIQKLETTENIY